MSCLKASWHVIIGRGRRALDEKPEYVGNHDRQLTVRIVDARRAVVDVRAE